MIRLLCGPVSRGIVVRDNEAFGNVSGIEIENSVDALVENNYSHDNTVGILVFILPGKTATEAANTRIVGNRLENNNLANFSRPEMTVNLAPDGSGLLILSADTTEATGNTFSGNKSFAIGLVAVTDFPEFFGEPANGWDIPVIPEGTRFTTSIINNGYDPDPEVISAGFHPGRPVVVNDRHRQSWTRPMPPASRRCCRARAGPGFRSAPTSGC